MPDNVVSANLDHSYYPSAKVRLVVRLDELGSQSSVVQGAQQLVPHTVLRGTGSPRAPLVVSKDPSAPPGVNRLLIAPAGAAPSTSSPQDQSQSQDDLTFAIAGIIPAKASLEMNGIRAADTLGARLRWVDCPVDPRAIRSCGIELYLGTVSADDYAKGVEGATRSAVSGGAAQHGVQYQEPLNLVPDEYVRAGIKRTNLRFQGFVDTWDIDWDDQGEAFIALSCRDNTALLIDTEAPAALGVGVAAPIDEAVAKYLANFPIFAGLSVEFRPSGTTPPQLNAAIAKAAYQPRLGAMVPTRGGGAVQKLAVWDYLTDLCGMLGLVIFVDGTTVVIQQPQTLFGNQQAGGTTTGRSDDPYVQDGGRVVDGTPYTRRTMVWGRNVKKQTIRRSFNKHMPTNIEVRCYSERRKRQFVSRFPDPGAEPTKLAVHALPGGAADQRWMVWRVRWVEDQATLDLIARQIYQNGRNEFLIEARTDDLSSFGGDNLDPDILDMKVGDPFDVLVAQDVDSSTFGETETALIRRTNEFMQGLGYDPGFAAAYARVYQAQVGFQTTFRLKAMGIEWNADADDEPSVTIAIRGINYVEVRLDKPLSP